MWNPFGFFKKAVSKSYLGVDIGTTSIKIAEVNKSGNRFRLGNYSVLETQSYLERVNTALQASTLKLFEKETVAYLRLMLNKGDFYSRQAVASLPMFSVFSTLIEMPDVPDAEINKILEFKARQYVPMAIASVTLDWVRISDTGILLMAVTNDQVARYQRIFGEAGLELLFLEAEGMSLARVLTAERSGVFLIIDIGSRSTGLVVAEDGILRYSGQTDFAGSSITRAIASGLGISNRRAEDLKRERGLIELGFGAEQELSTLMMPILDVIISEAKRVREGYENSYKKKVTGAILAGSGGSLLGIEDYVKRELKLPVEKAKTFDNFLYSEKIRSLVDELGPVLSVAAGAAIRPLS